MITKEVFERIVRSCRTAKRTSERIQMPHENDDVCETIMGDLIDAIYLMLGECTSTLDESITYTVLNSDMTDTECADVLFAIYNARTAYQPAPVFFTEQQKRNMAVGYRR